MKLDKATITKILGEVGRVATAVIIAVAVILQFLEGEVAEEVGEAVPTQLAILEAARPTPGVATPTARPGRGTPTATATKPLPASTPTPGSATETSMPPTAILTGTPVTGGCDETKWHPPLNKDGCHHHHGIDWAGVEPETGQTYEEIFAVDGFSLKAWFGKVGGVLQPATVTENENPTGRVFLFAWAGNGGCEKDFEGIATPMPDQHNCVVAVIYGVHAMAHLSHLMGNGLGDHSEVAVAKVCTPLPNGEANLNDCAIFAGAVRQSYPVLHADYKQDICYLPSTPRDADGNLFPLSLIDQPPYVTILPEEKYDPERNPGVIQSYWVGTKPNENVKKYHRPGINSIFNSAWLELDVWGPLPKELVCGKDLTVEEVKTILNGVPPVLENAHRKFKLNDFTILLPPVTTFPFDGFVNEKGEVVNPTLCNTEGQVCWPVFYSKNYKAKQATIHRGAEPGGCEPDDENPCIIFEFPGVEMIYPLWDVIPGTEHDH